jgi:hypothetical protein
MKTKLNLRLLFCLLIPTILLVPLLGCESENPDLESGHTVVLKSYFNEEVREAFLENPDTHINAAFLNLETGETASTSNPDIMYRLSCGSMCSPAIVVVNGAKLTDVGVDKPQKQACEKMLLKQQQGRGSITARQGWFSCVQTNNGKMGWVRYDKDFYSGLNKGEIQFTYGFWE